jgi:metal-dependent amidase/aminoacylase/carboxypeptidase family protein
MISADGVGSYGVFSGCGTRRVFLVGAADGAGVDYPHHHPRFVFDEAVIPWRLILMGSALRRM